ncbi:SAM-dependent methyltransferase [Actinocorallia populi]|uniref:SAM-dependent methyltransferase n=1 Tax=Actinocorallia populi TaxID=2079200 RepID=UPI0018E51EFE|nr:SAM-dependent methyltransferase [Actinocorallia populi]
MADDGPEIDKSVPHSARIWNYWLGGEDNYEVDREAGDAYIEVFPGIVGMAKVGRAFLSSAVEHLVRVEGVRQFLDVGAGLPAADNTHQLAQRLDPAARIVYVDHDPLVLVQARALLADAPADTTAFLDADMRDPGPVLERAAATLDFDRPIALMMMGCLGHVPDDGEALATVRGLLAGLPSGSYLALYDGHDENAALNEAQQGYDDTGAIPYKLRGADQIREFFTGLDLVGPGFVPYEDWPGAPAEFKGLPIVCGIGRKP